jgi:hypothetical protein
LDILLIFEGVTMKKSLIFIIILVAISLVSGEKLYYYGRGERIFLHTYKEMISIKWRTDVKINEKERILATIPNIRSYYNIERYQITIL